MARQAISHRVEVEAHGGSDRPPTRRLLTPIVRRSQPRQVAHINAGNPGTSSHVCSVRFDRSGAASPTLGHMPVKAAAGSWTPSQQPHSQPRGRVDPVWWRPKIGAWPSRWAPQVPRPRRFFPPEDTAEVVKLMRTTGKTVGQVAREPDLTETAVRQWVKQADLDAGRRSGCTHSARRPLRRNPPGAPWPAQGPCSGLPSVPGDQEAHQLASQEAAHDGEGCLTSLAHPPDPPTLVDDRPTCPKG
jgi:transposase-like protein